MYHILSTLDRTLENPSDFVVRDAAVKWVERNKITPHHVRVLAINFEVPLIPRCDASLSYIFMRVRVLYQLNGTKASWDSDYQWSTSFAGRA